MDIDHITRILIESFEEYGVMGSTMQQLKILQHNSAKVNFLENLLIKYNCLDKLNTGSKLRVQKSNIKSAEFRAKGNELFCINDYLGAFDLYNKSICFAERDSEHLSIGYANRSAVLFKGKLYKESLENIKLAKNAKYPQKLIHKLEKREMDCYRLLSTQEDFNVKNHDFNYKPHPIIPQVADGVYVKCTEEKGRSIHTKRALTVGKIISIEEPFCNVLLPNAKYDRCANCNLQNLALIPCRNCTCASFCSEKCMIDAECFHKFECPIIDFLHSKCNRLHLLTVRLTIVAYNLFGTFDELKLFCEQPQNQNQNLFTLDHKNLNRKEYFRAICGLLTNEKKRPLKELFLRFADAAILRYYLLRNTLLQDIFSGDREPKFFTEILFRHLLITFGNTGVICSYDNDAGGDSFAASVTSFSNLLNHSCASNTFRSCSENKTYLFVIRPIPVDGEIFTEYNRLNFTDFPRLTRQKLLSEHYYFDCKCDGCEGNYPVFDELWLSPNVPSVPIFSFELQIPFPYSLAQKNFAICCEFLEKYKNEYPCLQICGMETCLVKCFNMLVSNFSLKLIFKEKMFEFKMCRNTF